MRSVTGSVSRSTDFGGSRIGRAEERFYFLGTGIAIGGGLLIILQGKVELFVKIFLFHVRKNQNSPG